MGAIMAIGVAVANAILLVTFAERSRVDGQDACGGCLDGARSRLRPILMTSFAMIAGMIPMAIGLGEGGEQTAPLGSRRDRRLERRDVRHAPRAAGDLRPGSVESRAHFRLARSRRPGQLAFRRKRDARGSSRQ